MARALCFRAWSDEVSSRGRVAARPTSPGRWPPAARVRPAAPALPDFALHGTGVVVRSSAAFTTRPDFPAQVETTIDVTLRCRGGSWSDPAGTNVIFFGERGVSCAGVGGRVLRHPRSDRSERKPQ